MLSIICGYSGCHHVLSCYGDSCHVGVCRQYLSLKKEKDAMRDRQRRMREERDVSGFSFDSLITVTQCAMHVLGGLAPSSLFDQAAT